ncbi:MAG: hypothetical protein COB41_07380 [Proteobacteria bacterium]|nr:MAG: hypothetical protein COB41_07380 [Pseudomonadota bacterium]
MKMWIKGALWMLSFLLLTPAWAVSQAEDIATTIMLRGHPCGGKQVTEIQQKEDGNGNQTIRATCPNGVRYQIDVSAAGQVKVHPL